MEERRNILEKFCYAVFVAIDSPITWFRERIVEPNRPTYYYYHRKFRRVPTVDECYYQDLICIYEANEQFKRDKRVDSEILALLKMRRDDCFIYEGPDRKTKCEKLKQDYLDAAENWFIKYGDLGATHNVVDAFMKQKHRLIWERRKAAKEAEASVQQL